MLFREVDNIIRLGKWAYLEIPTGERCKGCPLLSEGKPWCCGLQPAIGLIFDDVGPFKDASCPRKEGV